MTARNPTELDRRGKVGLAYFRGTMKKRFTDCDIWEDEWFSKLPPIYKLFWKYVCDRCDSGGMWKPNYHLAGVLMGEQISEKSAVDLFNQGKDRVKVLPDGNWFVMGFAEFQYSKGITRDKNVFAGVYRVADAYNIDVSHLEAWYSHSKHGNSRSIVGQVLTNSRSILQDKDKDSSLLSSTILTSNSQLAFNQVWQNYPPKRRGRMGEALILWAQRKAPQWAVEALKELIKSEEWTKEDGKYIPSLSKWIDSQMWDSVKESHNIVTCHKCGKEGVRHKSKGMAKVMTCMVCSAEAQKGKEEAVASEIGGIE